jgi:membrane protein YdbS with pleckstrin-like domain
MPASTTPQTARLIQEPGAVARIAPDSADRETDVFQLSPVARAFPGHILFGVVCIGLGIGLAIRARYSPWPPWVALVPVALGLLLLLLVWITVKSCSYRLTTQRLFVRRGWLTRHLDELELYRVKDVVVDQGILERVLDYGTVTVLAADDTTPEVDLLRISSPTKVKEMIRTQYRTARQREGVHPTEFMRSP